ncbi:MAG: hypothetical protein RLZZ127_3148 [Planctomycetota bacterium]|jgi:RNA polymerase sigma-70 factor (ECF subfamily)
MTPRPLDRTTIAKLYIQCQPMLDAYVHSIVPIAADADDLAQEAGVLILTRDDLMVDPAMFPAWARGVARNLILHHWRHRRRTREHGMERLCDLVDTAWEEHEAETARRGELEGALQRLDRCLARLDERQRSLLHRFHVLGETAAEIGASLNRSADAVLMAVLRLRRRLRTCIERERT